MSNNGLLLTPQLSESIVSAVRAGSYPYVAAEAYGVSKRVFDDWLARGNRNDAEEPYRSFATGVSEAAAVARLLVETTLYRDDPETWLVHGPGRETNERPGWSVSVKAAEFVTGIVNVLAIPEIMNLLNKIFNVLQPHPPVRDQMLAAVAEVGIQLPTENDHGAARD